MRFIYIIIAVLAPLTTLSFQANAAAQISYFYDGDTVKILENKNTYKLRITHIDAPERNQAYGKKSRRALMQLCKDAVIKVNISGTDRYQRKLGSLYCNDKDVAEFMLANGHAWFNNRYSSDMALALKARTAREKKLGLWLDEQAVAPWVWRRQVKEAQKAQQKNDHAGQ